MRLVSYPRSFWCVARHAPVELSAKAQGRLRLLEAWRRLRPRGLSATEGARVLGVSRASLYRWERRVKREGLAGTGQSLVVCRMETVADAPAL